MYRRLLLWKILAVLLGCLIVPESQARAVSSPELTARRSDRRAALRARSSDAAKSAGSVPFGLLVIPVDFSDARLPSGLSVAQLAARLTAESGESLHHYFQVASAGLLDLQITVIPPVHLAGDRRSYSDRDLNGFTRTRKLATEAITAAAATGLQFRQLDNDGPDGEPGTADDDGQVDGVLILHAGPGQENDPASGLIQPLQFFLTEPVVSQGVSASFYAVASLNSGPGIWAHETAHLLGLEDRYDPLLQASGASEVQSVGGLGRFSLMSSGAWGTGAGYGAALPDAYSAWQVGWREAAYLDGPGPLSATVRPNGAAKLWTNGREGPEFFLLEVRDPEASAPFDAAVPGGELLIYHIDERLPEGAWAEDGPGRWHLRVRLVEADGGGSLAAGEDAGSAADLFPGATGATSFTTGTLPTTRAYDGSDTFVALTSIVRVADGVAFDLVSESRLTANFTYRFDGLGPSRDLSLSVLATGRSLPRVSVEMTALAGPESGVFEASGTRTMTFTCVETIPGIWRPAGAVRWLVDATQDPSATTRFTFRFFDGDQEFGLESREWLWDTNPRAVDFSGEWPGSWTVGHPGGNTATTWHRWPAAALGGTGGFVLACTGAGYEDGGEWPSVSYENNAYTTLTSAPLDRGCDGILLTHALEAEVLSPGLGMDGGTVVWVGPDETEIPAVPSDGYSGQIATRARNPLHGQAAFVGGNLEFRDSAPLWQASYLPLPDEGPGPWRLRLVFGANSLWRARGWFVREIAAIRVGEVPPVPQVVWNGDLRWRWPLSAVATQDFAVETRTSTTEPWQLLIQTGFAPDQSGWFQYAGTELLAGGRVSPGRLEVRVVGEAKGGMVASAPIVVYPEVTVAGAGVFPAPWPNPAVGEVRFMLDLAPTAVAELRVFDLRGRLVAARDFAGGRQLAGWDGIAADGTRAAAGTYLLRLETSGQIITRKVVLLH